MNNQLILKEINISKNRIEYSYDVIGYWRRYFQLENCLYVEYSVEVGNIPEHLAVIPFIYVFMPLAWMFQAKVVVNTIDQKTLDGLNRYQNVAKSVYPKLRMYETDIEYSKLEIGSSEHGMSSAVYFSGGVDAWATVARYMEENPYLVTILGGDVDNNNDFGKQKVIQDTILAAKTTGLKPVWIESNLRKVVNEVRISKYLASRAEWSYWQVFPTGIGILGLSAPLTNVLGLKKVYIATSFSSQEISKLGMQDANAAELVKTLSWENTDVQPYAEDETRQEKIQRVVKFCKGTGKNIYIRSCWKDTNAKNCCKCEKCLRTMVGLAAEGVDPKDYGFSVSKLFLARVRRKLRLILKNEQREHELDMFYCFWEDIQRNYKGNVWYLKWLKKPLLLKKERAEE